MVANFTYLLKSKTFLFQAISSQTVLIQSIQFCIGVDFVCTQLNFKAVLFQTIQFSVNTVSMSKTVPFQIIQFSIHEVPFQTIQFSIIDRTLPGATTPGQGGPGINGNEGVLHIPQSSSITGTSPLNYLVSYLGHSSGGGLTPSHRSGRCILPPQLTGQIKFSGTFRLPNLNQNTKPSIR